MLSVQSYGQPQKATPIYVTAAPAQPQQVQTLQVQRVAQVQQVQPAPQPQPMQPMGDECMGCDCGMGCGGGGGFPTMSYFAIAGLLILFGVIHIAVGIAAAIYIEDCDMMMPMGMMMTTMAPATPPAPPPPMLTMSACAYFFTMLATLIGTGLLYTIAGCLGVCAASCMTAHVRAGLKTGFLVLAILSAVVVVGSIAMLSQILVYADVIPQEMLALAAIGVVGGVVVFILSVVGSGIACCCSPVSEDGF